MLHFINKILLSLFICLGIIVNSYAQDIEPSEIKSIEINYLNTEDKIDFLKQEYLGRDISYEILEELSMKIYDYYNSKNYLFPRVHITEEDQGKLKVQVEMLKINNIFIIADEDEKNELFLSYSKKILASKPAMIDDLQKYTALMNEIPGYYVEYEISEDETIDLYLLIEKSKGNISAGIDNYGTKELGITNNLVSFEIFSPFNKNETISGYATSTNHTNRFYDIGLNYNKAINNIGTSINLSASHSEDDTTVDDPINTRNGLGTNLRAAVNHHLYLDGENDLIGEIAFNYSHFKNYITDFNFIDKRFVTQDIYNNFFYAELGLQYIFSDAAKGYNFSNLVFTQGVSGTFKNYSYPSNIPNQNYQLVQFDFYRDQALFEDFSVYSHFSAGYSADDMPYPLSLGGRDFGRAYDFGAISGNQLIAVSHELRYTKYMDHDFVYSIQPYIFYDIGYVGKQYEGTDTSHLSSTGIGIRFMLNPDIEFGTEIANPLVRKYTVDGVTYDKDIRYSVYINKTFRF